MSGLIFGGMVQGLGNAAASIGGNMSREQDRQSELSLRLDTQREMQQEKLANLREIAEMRASASHGGKDGPFMPDVAEGSMAEESMASRLNMSVPELRKLRAANKSGDTSGYSVDTALPGPTEDGSELHGKTKPAGLEQWMADKRTALADIQQEFIYGGKYDDVAKGRREELGNKVGAGIIGGKIAPDVGAEQIGALKGEGAWKEAGGTMYNQYTSDNDSTAVGDSEINKNNAKAKHEGDVAKSDTLKSLTQERVSASGAASDARRELATLQGMTDKISSKDKPAHVAAIAAAQAKLERYETERDDLAGRIREYTSTGKVSPDKSKTSDNGIVKPPADASTPPDIKSVSGAPAGSSIGKYDPKHGWSVVDRAGKTLGYTRK